MFCNNCKIMFEVIDSREERCIAPLQRTCYVEGDRVAPPSDNEDEAVAQEALDRTDVREKALPYITYAMFSKLHSLVQTRQLYSLKDKELSDWPVVKNSHFET